MQSSTTFTVLVLASCMMFILAQSLEDDVTAEKRMRSFAFAKRSPYRSFAFAKRADELEDGSEMEKRARFAFAKRSPYRSFAFAKRASPYGFAFAKRDISSFA